MLEQVSLWQVVQGWANDTPDELATSDGRTRLTARELEALATELSAGLAERQVGPGCRVFARARGYVEFAALAVAAARLGAVFCPVNPMLGPGEVANLAELIAPTIMVDVSDEDIGPEWTSVGDLLRGGAAGIPHEADWADLALLGFTGGTTGTPKAVMHNWSTTGYAVRNAASIAGLLPGDGVLATLPIGSAPGFVFSLHLALRLRGALILRPKFDASEHLAAAQQDDARWTMGVPTQIALLADAAEASGADRPWRHMKAVAVGGAPMQPTDVRRWETQLGAPALRMFGLSECLGHCSTRPSDPSELRYRIDGYPFPGTELEAFDVEGRQLSRGSRGQAGVRGPSLFTGYYAQEELTRSRFTADGFFLTGDTIVRNADGALEVLGRESDLIIRGGMNIDPKEIEEILSRNPAVRASAVVGAPDSRMGEVVAAFVVPRDGRDSVTLTGLREHFEREQIARFKWPELLYVLDDLPTSAMGKVQKKSLAAWLSGEGPALRVLDAFDSVTGGRGAENSQKS